MKTFASSTGYVSGSLSLLRGPHQFVDEGDGLQIRKVPAIVLNKQSLTADKRWSSSL